MNFLESTYGVLSSGPSSIGMLSIVAQACVLGFIGAPLWGVLVRFVCPVAVVIVLVYAAITGNYL